MNDGATSCAELSSILILTDEKIFFMSKRAQTVKTIRDFSRLYFPIFICHQQIQLISVLDADNSSHRLYFLHASSLTICRSCHIRYDLGGVQ